MYSLSQTQSSVFEALEEGLTRIGGVPERIQTDNHATLYIAKKKEWNPRYLQFASHYGFQPSRSEVRHPWSKGKVENPFSYLENHFMETGTVYLIVLQEETSGSELVKVYTWKYIPNPTN